MERKFTSKLSPVEVGQVITVYGKTRRSAKSFSVELTEAEDEKQSEEIHFHMWVRFEEMDEILRGSHSSTAKWEKKEKEENLIPGNELNPIKPGNDFKVSIFIDQKLFYISLDDKPYCTFVHRNNLSRIKRLNVLRDVEKVYQVQHTSARNEKWPALIDITFRLSTPRKIKPGDIFVITGATRGSNDGTFALNIFDENVKRLVFHMRAKLDKKSVMLNAQCKNHNWQNGVEFLLKEFPFGINEHFKLAVGVRSDNFLFVVNGTVVGVLPFWETPETIFSSMNGIEIQSRDGTTVDVQSFDNHYTDLMSEDFDGYVAKMTQ